MAGVIGVLSGPTSFWSNLTASARATQFSRFRRLVEGAFGITLWSVPAIFWAIIFRFVVKHW